VHRLRVLSPALAVTVPFVLVTGCAALVGIGTVPDGPDVLPDGSVINPFDAPGFHFDALGERDGGSDSPFILPPADGSDDGGNPGSVGDAGLPYAASNIGGMKFQADVTGPLNLVGNNCIIYTDWPDPESIGCEEGNQPMDMFSVNMPDGAGTAVIYVFSYINIDSQSQLLVHGPNPLILISLGSVDIQGSIDVSADNYDSDSDINVIPGARNGGPGAGAYSSEDGPQGGGGGSFCGTGGTGAEGQGATASDSAPGAPYGAATLVPLWGGSPGGGVSAGGADGFANGYGGGVLQISAAGNITVGSGAYITANGSGGVSQGDESGDGAGSGGAILLEAPTVTIAGVLVANGGEGSDNNMDGAMAPDDGGVATEQGCGGGNGGYGAHINGSDGTSVDGGYGGGGGGVGWIRINGTHVSITGVVSPTIGSGCASEGPLP
jgi:hypothetical protein